MDPIPNIAAQAWREDNLFPVYPLNMYVVWLGFVLL